MFAGWVRETGIACFIIRGGMFATPFFHRFSFLINTTEVFSMHSMNSKQMKKWLEQQGATFQPGKGSHLKVFLNGRQSALPMHGTTELGKGLEAAIKRQLGLK